MVGVFVRLKATLLWNGLRGMGWRLAFVLIAGLYAFGFAVAGFGVLVSTGPNTKDGPTIAVLVGSALAFGWIVFPLLGLGSDGSLDPTRLSLLPLTRRTLMTGLLAASLVGVGATASAVALFGAVIGFTPAGPGAVLVALAGITQLLVCVSASRALVTWLSAAMRSRRGRDLRVVLVAVIALAPQALRLLIFANHTGGLVSYRSAANVLSWFPTALAMRAMVTAGKGHLLPAVAELAACVALIVVLLWWWSRSLDHMLTTADAPAAVPRARGIARGDPLFGAAGAWLPRTRLGAVAARELRSTWREPRLRVQLVSSFVLPFILVAGVLSTGGAHQSGVVYAALLVVALSGGNRGYNQIGTDGRAWWLHEACGANYRADLGGKNIALFVATIPVLVAAAAVLAAITGGWGEVVPTVLFGIALEGIQLAIGDMLSVLAPWSVPTSRTNLWSTNSGQGCLAGLLAMGGLAAQALLAVPFVVAALVWRPEVVVVALLAIPYGAALWALGSRSAARIGTARGAEILVAVSAGEAARAD